MAKTILDPQCFFQGWLEGGRAARGQVANCNLQMLVPRLASGAPCWKLAKPQGSKMVVAISPATTPSRDVATTISDPAAFEMTGRGRLRGN